MPIVRHSHDPALRDVLSYHRPATWIESFASMDWAVEATLEHLQVSGWGDGSGNALDNVITGDYGNNRVWGMDGDDVLDGQGGRDGLTGGRGDDTSVVDDPGDWIVELAGEGIDTVKASTDYTLSEGLENLSFLYSHGFTGNGNAADNVMTGNSGGNTLNGLGGNDTLDGGGGWDRLVGGDGSDTYLMGSGYGADTIVETQSQAGDHDVARFSGISHDRLWLVELPIICGGCRYHSTNEVIRANAALPPASASGSTGCMSGSSPSASRARDAPPLPAATRCRPGG